MTTTDPTLPLCFDSQPALPFAAAPWSRDGDDCEPGWLWTADGQERRVVDARPL